MVPGRASIGSPAPGCYWWVYDPKGLDCAVPLRIAWCDLFLLPKRLGSFIGLPAVAGNRSAEVRLDLSRERDGATHLDHQLCDRILPVSVLPVSGVFGPETCPQMQVSGVRQSPFRRYAKEEPTESKPHGVRRDVEAKAGRFLDCRLACTGRCDCHTEKPRCRLGRAVRPQEGVERTVQACETGGVEVERPGFVLRP